jgi:hypothetical protein
MKLCHEQQIGMPCFIKFNVLACSGWLKQQTLNSHKLEAESSYQGANMVGSGEVPLPGL